MPAIAGASRKQAGVYFDKGGSVFNPKHPDFAAKGDARLVADGAITTGTPTFASASAGFTAADVGKAITVSGAGPAGALLTTTILAYVSATTVTLAANASTTVAAAAAVFGSDDTTPLQDAQIAAAASAIPGDIALSPGADFYTGALPTNTQGTRFIGAGRILKPITGGAQQINSYTDLYQPIIGREYLYAFHAKVLAEAATTIVLSGDSTTSGTGVTGNYVPDVLLGRLAVAKGIRNQTVNNRGQTGKDSLDWQTTYLAGDLALVPDLLVVRWGINDPFYGRTAAQYIATMRACLTTIRASRTVAQTAILIMAPNATSDTPNGRDEKFYESVIPALRQMARDFQCAFYDTYAKFKDSRGAAGKWMDDPFADGRAIHPGNGINAAIYSDVADILYPPGLLPFTRGVTNYGDADAVRNTATVDSTFAPGVTIFRANKVIDASWPLDGAGMVFRQVDGVYALELNWAYTGGGDSGIALRIGQSGTWLGWLKLYGNKLVPTNSTAWALRDSTDAFDNLSVVQAGTGTFRGAVICAGTGVTTAADTSGRITVGRNSSGFPFSYFTPSSTSSGWKFQSAGSADILTLANNADMTQHFANGANWVRGSNTELLTLSTVGTTTDTAANLLPANAIIEVVVARVITTITTATDWKLGDPATAARFSAASVGLASGSTVVGMQHQQGSIVTDAAGPVQAAAAKVRVTTTGIPAAGAIRITVYYRQFVAPTS